MNEIKKYKGNEEQNFKKLIDKLNEPLKLETYYINSYDISKYVGKKINGEYEGRGILYDKNNHIKYNGYFKKGK